MILNGPFRPLKTYYIAPESTKSIHQGPEIINVEDGNDKYHVEHQERVEEEEDNGEETGYELDDDGIEQHISNVGWQRGLFRKHVSKFTIKAPPKKSLQCCTCNQCQFYAKAILIYQIRFRQGTSQLKINIIKDMIRGQGGHVTDRQNLDKSIETVLNKYLLRVLSVQDCIERMIKVG